LGLVAAAGCGTSSNNNGPGNDGGPGSNDGGPLFGDTGTNNDGAPNGPLPDGGVPGSPNGCPPYEIPCNGACIPWNDPNHCGACNTQCTPSQVCSFGVCQSAAGNPCPLGTIVCDGTCVDPSTDNNHCGNCQTKCNTADAGMTQACVSGSCTTATVFPPPTPTACINGGPPTHSGPPGTGQCNGNIGQTGFDFGIGSCTSILVEGTLLVDGWDSTQGPYMPGVNGGGIGADTSITGSTTTVWGPAYATGSPPPQHTPFATGLSVDPIDVHLDVQSGGNTGGAITARKDAYVVQGASTGGLTVAGMTYRPASISTAIDCSMPVPVVSYVAYASTHNDDQSIGLDPNILAAANHPARIDLPCGIYYLKGFSLTGNATIVGHGQTAIYIDGTIDAANGILQITLDTTMNSALDVFVSQTITTGSDFSFGSTIEPALSRLYIGSTGQFDMQSGLVIAGELWAGNANVLYESGSNMFGALLGKSVDIASSLNLHHDRAIYNVGGQCNPPPSAGGDAGGPPVPCTSCTQCGNQACVSGMCGSCMGSADCCAPLTCVGGTCRPPLK
jgi:hypothetical protein